MNEEQVRQIIREEISSFVKSDKYIFEKLVVMSDGRNIQLGKGTGTMIGTEATQKLGFFGTTPIVQIPTGVLIQPTGGSTVDNEARARINDLNQAFFSLGLAHT